MLSINQLSPAAFTNHPSDLRHAIVIAVLALQCYIADVKTLVSTAIKKACGSEDAQEIMDARCTSSQDRLLFLKKWLKTKKPLSYNEKAFEKLLRCLVPDPTNYSDGLPHASAQKLSVNEFALRICRMSRIKEPVAIAAPLISNASSTSVFRIAFVHMLKYAPVDSPSAAEVFIQQAIMTAVQHLEIHHVPWSPPPAVVRGRPARKPVYDSWLSLGLKSATPANAERIMDPADMAAEASRKAQASDSRAPWAVESITLQSLPEYMQRDSLPDEFCMESIECGRDPIVQDIYAWVFNNFDARKPIHFLALLAGIYISQMLPDVFWDEKDRPANSKLFSVTSATRCVRNMPWRAKEGSRKGFTSGTRFIAMMPAYIVAVYEPNSPLRQYFSRKRSFPSAWNAKNSAKGIGPLNMVRMGLAKTSSSRIFKGGVPLTDWVLLNNSEIASKYEEMAGYLRDKQYGPFLIGVAFFGSDKAVEIGSRSGCYTNKPSVVSICFNKRAAGADDEEEESEDGRETKRARH